MQALFRRIGAAFVGRGRDVVVVIRQPPRPPRVLGLVVEVPPHRRVFLPITRVTNIDAGQVYTSRNGQAWLLSHVQSALDYVQNPATRVQ